MNEFLMDNIYVRFDGQLFRQMVGIPMGTNCAPLLADLFLYSYENEFLDKLVKEGKRKLARRFNLSYRYIVYASQLVHYAHCCSSYSDFLMCHRALVKRLLSQGYKVNRLSNTFKKFYGRHTDLVGQYKKNVCQMFADSIS